MSTAHRLIPAILLLSAMTGCASSKMTPVTHPTSFFQLGPDEVMVTFMRSSFTGSAIQASLFELVDDQEVFIGIISNDSKIAYKTTAGEKMFMVVSENADFMRAELEPGRSYYAMVTPRMGIWKARFSLRPIRKADFQNRDVHDWERSCQFVANKPEAIQWAKDNEPDIKNKRQEYLAKWQGKDQAGRDEQTLFRDDWKE